MLFLALGIVLLVLKLLEFGPVAGWSWWIVLLPFALATVWWWWADSSGYTARRAMDRMDRRKQDRQDRQYDALGLGLRKKKGRRR